MPGASSPRTTIRWDDDELRWLEGAAAARADGRVGSVVRAVVRAAMEAERSAAAREGVSSGAVGRVPAGAAPVPPSGAAPARLGRRWRLDSVVARLLCPGPGAIAPVDLVRARRLIAGGGVDVSGRGVHELAPELLVGPGEVVLR